MKTELAQVFILFIYWCHGAFRDWKQPPASPISRNNRAFCKNTNMLNRNSRDTNRACWFNAFFPSNRLNCNSSPTTNSAFKLIDNFFLVTLGCFIMHIQMEHEIKLQTSQQAFTISSVRSFSSSCFFIDQIVLHCSNQVQRTRSTSYCTKRKQSKKV